MGFHAGVVVVKVLGVDCSVFIPEVFEELDRSAANKFSYWVFESGEIFFREVICNHRDKDYLKFTEDYLFFTRYFVSTDNFSDLGSSDATCIRWVLSWVGWWNG